MKKLMKSRIFLFILIITLVMSSGVMTAFAANEPCYRIESTSAESGSTVSVKVTAANSSNAYDGNFTLKYDSSKLELLDSYSFGEDIESRNKNYNPKFSDDSVRLTFNGTTPLKDGTLITLNFKVKDTASGSAELSFAAYKMYDMNGASLSPTATNGAITIKSGTAVSEAKLYIDSIATTPGETISVPVKIKNAADVYDGNFTLKYDSSNLILLDSYSFGEDIESRNKNYNPKLTNDSVRLTFNGTTPLKDGTLITLNFKVSDDAFGLAELKFTAYKLYDVNGQPVQAAADGTRVNVEADKDVNRDNGFVYEIYESGEVGIISYEGTDTDIRIPSTLGGHPVTRICGLWECDFIKSVYIPSSVTYIFEDAFEDCDVLEKIEVAEDNEGYCSVDGVLFNKDKTSILRCPQAKSGSYDIPSGVEFILENAFSGCRSLTSISIPESVLMIMLDALTYCDSLERIDVAVDNSVFCSVDGILFDKDMLFLYRYPEAKTGSYDIPSGVRYICEYAFFNCTMLDDITIPEGVEEIQSYAFVGCNSLESIDIPSSVEYIGDFAFLDCWELEDITFPSTLKTIGYGAFCATKWYESQIGDVVYAGNVAYSANGELPPGTEIELKDGTVSIADEAFISCYGLTSITIPDSVESIGYLAFLDCTELKSVTIPASVTFIDMEAFGYNYDSEVCETVRVEDFTIYGFSGSAAERYAYDNNIDFISIGTVAGLGFFLGDANRDGSINVKDATHIQKMVAGLVDMSEYERLLSDVDGNGLVNVKDATAIQKYAAGLNAPDEIGVILIDDLENNDTEQKGELLIEAGSSTVTANVGDKVTYSAYLRTNRPVVGIQAILRYDESKLELIEVPGEEDEYSVVYCPNLYHVSKNGNISRPYVNQFTQNCIKFNSTTIEGFDFTGDGLLLITADFMVLEEGCTDISMDMERIFSFDMNNENIEYEIMDDFKVFVLI